MHFFRTMGFATGAFIARSRFRVFSVVARLRGVHLGTVGDTNHGCHVVVTDLVPDGTERTAVFLDPDRTFIDLYFPAPVAPTRELVSPPGSLHMRMGLREGISLLDDAARRLHGAAVLTAS